jgi:hypothetical protein
MTPVTYGRVGSRQTVDGRWKRKSRLGRDPSAGCDEGVQQHVHRPWDHSKTKLLSQVFLTVKVNFKWSVLYCDTIFRGRGEGKGRIFLLAFFFKLHIITGQVQRRERWFVQELWLESKPGGTICWSNCKVSSVKGKTTRKSFPSLRIHPCVNLLERIRVSAG